MIAVRFLTLFRYWPAGQKAPTRYWAAGITPPTRYWAAAATSGNPNLAYAVTGDIGTMYAAQQADPAKTVLYQQMGNPTMTYLLTKDAELALASALPQQGTPVQGTAPVAPVAPV